MLYTDYLKKEKPCPFCGNRSRKLLKNADAYLTYSLAPYSEYHLLMIPNKHIEKIDQLNKKTLKSIYELISAGIEILEAKKIDDYTILARNGDNTGKSVKHLHFQLIPKHHIGDMDENSEKRKILNKKEIEHLVLDLKRTIKDLR